MPSFWLDFKTGIIWAEFFKPHISECASEIRDWSFLKKIEITFPAVEVKTQM